MKTDQNSNMQGTLNKRISMKKRRNAKRALLALNLVAVIFTTTVFSNPVSVLSEEVSTDTVQSIENSPGTDAQIAEQADVQQNTAEAAQAVEAPAAEAPAAENSAEAAKAEEPSGVNAPAENAMSAEMNAAEDGVVSTDDGASSASAVQSADTSSASNGSFEDAGAGNTDGTKDGIIENDAEGLNEAEGTAANEESEDAASQEQLTYEDEHVKISASYTDGRAFTADSILTGTYLDSDEKNAVLSAVNAQISKGNSADTVSDTAENTEGSGSAPVASTTATTVEYSVAGFHALMLAAKNQDGSDTTTEGDVTFSAEFKKGLNDAGYASREETTENNEAGGDGSLTTTTTRCETSWKIYTVTEKNLTDITDITDAHNTHYEMDENGTLKSASFRGALPQTVAFVQIVKKTVTETTTQKETEKATEKETQKVTEKYTEKITGKAAEKTTETETEKEDVKAEVPASAAMPAVAFDQKVTTGNGTVMVHIDAEEGAFEEGTSMTVTPVTRHDILDKAIDAAGGKGAAAAMDITFTKADGTKTEPLKPIHVKMISPVLNHAEEAHVVHVADSGTIDVVARKSDGKTIESTSSEAASSDAKNAVSFESDSFSVYAIVYTVDFEYSVNGKMYQFSLPGGEKIALSDLIEVLGIIGDTNNGEKAAFNSVDSFLKEVANVESSDESLVKVTQNEEGNDWTLESLEPFDTEESLTITMKNGDVVTVKVTDAQFTSDLGDILTDIYIKIDGNKVPDGSTIDIQTGQVFDLHLEFQENDFLQLPEDNTAMTFPLPEGINLGDQPFSKKVDVDLGLDGKVRGNTLSYDPVTNTLSFTWNRRDPRFSRLISTDNTKLVFDVTGQFDSDASHVDFGLGYDITVNQTEPKDANITKDGELFLPGAANNPFGNQAAIKYTVTVTSEGETTVNVNDQVDGSAVTLVTTQGGSTGWTASSDKGTTITPTFDSKGFSLNGQSLQDGEVVTITYWGKIDTSNIENLQNVSYSQTGNKVTVTGEGIPDKEVTHYEHVVGTNKLDKSATGVEAVGEDGKQVVHWKIVLNDPPVESIGGTTLTDKIASDSLPYMSYNTSGIHVVARTASGVERINEDVSWSDSKLNLTNENYDKHWVYNIPATNEALVYEITYDTVVDTTKYNNGNGGYFSVVNESEGKPGKDTGTATVGKPVGEAPTPDITYSKTAVDINEETVTWNIPINIKAGDYNEFSVVDTLPTMTYGSNIGYTDEIQSITVTGLEGTEWYATSYQYNNTNDAYKATGDNEKPSDVILTFYKNGAIDGDISNANGNNSPTNPGLTASSDRIINIQIVTKNNQKWMELGREHYTESTATDHKNNVKVNDYNKIEASAKPLKKTVMKLRDGKHTVSGPQNYAAFTEVSTPGTEENPHGVVVNETQTTYPMYKFWVLVGGITDGNLEYGNQIIISDTFNEHLRLMIDQGVENDKAPKAYGTSDTGSRGSALQFDASKGQTFTWSQSNGQATFTLTNPPKNGDNYYPYYLVEYWLVPKSEEDLVAIKKLAMESDGTALLENVATSDKISDELDFTYDYSVIDKTSTTDTSGSVTLLKYTIDINKDCMTLNDGEPMTMTDTYSRNLSIDFGTVEVVEAVDKTGADRTADVTWDFRNNVGTYTIPDETHVKIQYYARPIGDPGSIQTVTNTAYMEGYYDTVTEDQMVDMSGSGSAEVVRIRLLKFGADHMEEGLNGAVFRLLDQDRNPLKTFTTAETGFVNRYGVLHAGNDALDYEYDESTGNYKINIQNNWLTSDAQTKKTTITSEDFGELTWHEYVTQHSDSLICYNDLTDAGLTALGITRHAGFAEIMMNQSIDGMALKKERVYYLQEIIAPTGYELDTTLYSFLISDKSNYAAPAGVYVYHNNDILTVRNWPEETPVLKLQKTFTGNVELTDEQKNAVTFQIQKKVSDIWTDYTVPVWRDGSKQDVSTFTYGDYGVSEDTSTTPSTYSQGNLLFENGVMVIENLPAGEYRVIESKQTMEKPGGGNYDRRTEYLVDGSKVRVNGDIINYDSETGAETTTPDAETNGVVFTTDGTSSHFVSITNTYYTEEFTLTKTAADTGELLGNAKFAIYSRTDSNTDTLINDNIATDANGKIEIQKTGNSWDPSITFTEDTLYYIVETGAPTGYITPESPDKYYFYFSSEDSVFDPSSLLPTGEKAVDLSTGFGSARVSNNRDAQKTYVNVKKAWVNSLGQDITASMTDAEGVSVTLKRTTAKPTAGKAITVVDIDEVETDLSELHTLTLTNGATDQSATVYFLPGDKLQITLRGSELTSVYSEGASPQTNPYTALTKAARSDSILSWTAIAPDSDLAVTVDSNNITDLAVANVTAANRSYVLTETEAESLNGEVVTDGTVTLDTQNNWAHTFSNLPVADESGNSYFYYITEPSSNAQDTSIGISGKEITVTNTAPDQLEVNKKWEDVDGNSINTEKTDGSITYELYQVENPLEMSTTYTHEGNIGVNIANFYKSNYYPGKESVTLSGDAADGKIKSGSNIKIEITTSATDNNSLTGEITITGGTTRGTGIGADAAIIVDNPEQGVVKKRTIYVDNVTSTVALSGTFQCSGGAATVSVTVTGEPSAQELPFNTLVQNKMGEVVVTYDDAALTKEAAFSTSNVRVSPGTKPWSSLIYNLDSKGTGTGANAGQRVNYTYYVVETPSPVATNYDAATYQVDGQNVAIANGEPGDTIVIINKENQPPYGSLSITKAIQTGSPDASGKTFTFEVELKNADASAYTGNVKVQDSTRTTATEIAATNGKITVTVTGTGTATISDIPAGTAYVVTEPTENLPAGWSQDGTVTYGDSTQTIAANDTDTATVTNKYEATGSVDFKVTKNFKNATFSNDKKFEFKLTQVTSADGSNAATADDVGTGAGKIPALVLATSKTVDTTGATGSTATIGFNSGITFNQDEVGTYYFLIEEVVPEEAQTSPYISEGIQYPAPTDAKKVITVTVEDKGDGTLTVKKGDVEYNPNDNTADATFTNEELTDFTFYKVWHNETSQKVAWGDITSITVTVGRKAGDNADENFSFIYDVSKEAFTEAGTSVNGNKEGAPTLKAILVPAEESDTVPQYKFYMENLPKKNDSGTDYVYFVTEQQVDGYAEPNYAVSQKDGVAYNKGIIINKPLNAVALPSTGGPGTLLYSMLGMMLIAFAGTAYMILLRRRRASLKGVITQDDGEKHQTPCHPR